MSIYSGFATRQQQSSYDECLSTLVYLLQKRIIKFYKAESADQQKFKYALAKLYKQMRTMQKHKYLQPKNSHSFQQLILLLQSNEKQHRKSEENQKNQMLKFQSKINQSRENFNNKQLKIFNNMQDVQQNNKISKQLSHQPQKCSQTFQLIRPSSNNYFKNHQKYVKNYDKKDILVFTDQKGYEIKGKQQLHIPNENGQKPKIQHILNGNASKLVSVSRNQYRSFAQSQSRNSFKIKGRTRKPSYSNKNSAYNIKQQKSRITSLSKQHSQENYDLLNHKIQGYDQQLSEYIPKLQQQKQIVSEAANQIIKNYMNKAKKMLIKNYKKKISELSSNTLKNFGNKNKYY